MRFCTASIVFSPTPQSNGIGIQRTKKNFFNVKIKVFCKINACFSR